jgi:hypothetical protein
VGEFSEDVGVAAAFRDGVNWEATSHQQIYDWFVQGPPESMRASVEAWSDRIAAHVEAASDAVTQALQSSGVHWEGQAAEAMQSSTGPLADHALRNQVAAMLAGGATSQQVTDASDLASMIPEPQPARTQQELIDANGGDFFNYLEDVQAQEAAAQEAESRARELAASYDASTDFAVSALPQFNPAVSVTTGVAPPSQPGPDVIEYGGPGPGGESGGGPGTEPGTGPGADGGLPTGPASAAPPPAAVADTPGGTSGQSWTPPQSGGQSTPTAPVGPPVPDGGRPAGPAPGLVAGPGGLQTGGGSGSRTPGGAGRLGGQGGSAGGQLGARGGGAPGPGAGVRGGPGAVESPAGRGGTPTAGRAPGAPGMAPMGAAGGRGQGDEDTERTSPEYLRDHHDEFWDDTPPVAPPVIGEDDDE